MFYQKTSNISTSRLPLKKKRTNTHKKDKQIQKTKKNIKPMGSAVEIRRALGPMAITMTSSKITFGEPAGASDFWATVIPF